MLLLPCFSYLFPNSLSHAGSNLPPSRKFRLSRWTKSGHTLTSSPCGKLSSFVPSGRHTCCSVAVLTLVNAPRQSVRSSVSGVCEWPVKDTAFGNALSAAVE